MIQSNLGSVYLIMLCLFFSVTFAQTKKETINIDAHDVTYDYKKNTVNYHGNVHATQGQTELNADKMDVYYNERHKIKKVVAIGDLARYKTLLNNNKDILNASAREIIYYPIEAKVILKEAAKIEYNQNQFSGPYIFYDMNKKIISSHPQRNSQSKIVLEPIKQLKNTLR